MASFPSNNILMLLIDFSAATADGQRLNHIS
jgi:hypothetical protein